MKIGAIGYIILFFVVIIGGIFILSEREVKYTDKYLEGLYIENVPTAMRECTSHQMLYVALEMRSTIMMQAICYTESPIKFYKYNIEVT